MSISSGNARPAPRTSGSIGSILINAILLYAAHHVLEWQISWITPAWSDVLWAIDLTLEVSIAVNVLFLLFGARSFRNLAGAVSCAVAVLATWWLYVVFPFDFGSAATNDVARVLLIVGVGAMIVATLASALVGVVELARGLRVQSAAHRF